MALAALLRGRPMSAPQETGTDWLCAGGAESFAHASIGRRRCSAAAPVADLSAGASWNGCHSSSEFAPESRCPAGNVCREDEASMASNARHVAEPPPPCAA